MATREIMDKMIRRRPISGIYKTPSVDIGPIQQPQPSTPTVQNLAPIMFNKPQEQNPLIGGLLNAGRVLFTGQMPKEETQSEDAFQKALATQQAKEMFEDPVEKQVKLDYLRERTKGIGNQRSFREDQALRASGTQLRGELSKHPTVERFRTLAPMSKSIDSVLTDTLSRPDLSSKNIGDQALITYYNKILDPTSVVRESEYSRTPEGLAMMNRIQGFMEKVQAGGSGITDQDRVEIARMAKVLLNNAGEDYNRAISQYESLAGEYGVPSEYVLTGYDRYTPANLEFQMPQATSPQAPASGGVETIEQKKARLLQKYSKFAGA